MLNTALFEAVKNRRREEAHNLSGTGDGSEVQTLQVENKREDSHLAAVVGGGERQQFSLAIANQKIFVRICYSFAC